MFYHSAQKVDNMGIPGGRERPSEHPHRVWLRQNFLLMMQEDILAIRFPSDLNRNIPELSWMWKEWGRMPTNISYWNCLSSKEEFQNNQWSYFKTFLSGCSIFISLWLILGNVLGKVFTTCHISHLKVWLPLSKIKKKFPSSKSWVEEALCLNMEPKHKIWGKELHVRYYYYVSLCLSNILCVTIRKAIIVLLVHNPKPSPWKALPTPSFAKDQVKRWKEMFTK